MHELQHEEVGDLRTWKTSLAVLVGVVLAVAFIRATLSSEVRAGQSPAVYVGRAHRASFYPTAGDQPLFILVLGSDARPGESVERSRSDGIHVIGVDPEHRRASIIDIPRDSWVAIPNHGSNKINAAMTMGGPELTIQTVESLTGIRFDYYALTSFPGLTQMVNGVGGLKIDIPYAITDPTVGQSLDPGLQRIGGDEALAFARARYSVPGGDFGRTKNQGDMLLAALRQFRREFSRDPSISFRWISAFMRNVSTDLDIGEVMNLAFTAAQINPARVKNVALEGSVGTRGSQSVVYLRDSSHSVFADIRSDGTIDHGA